MYLQLVHLRNDAFSVAIVAKSQILVGSKNKNKNKCYLFSRQCYTLRNDLILLIYIVQAIVLMLQ